MKDFSMVTRWVALLIAATTALCGIATADSIVVTGVDASRGEYNVWIGENGADVNSYFAGVILIQLTDTAGVFDRDTMCVQLFVDINLGSTYGTTVVTPDSQPGRASLDRVSWLLDNALLPAQNGGATSSALPQADWVTTAAQGAGLQLAIWDIVENGGDGFTKGTVQQGSAAHPTDASVLSWANYYESNSSLPADASGDAFVYLNVNTGSGAPAQTLEGPGFPHDGGPQPTPEASTLVLAGTALTALGLVGRRKIGKLVGGSAKH
jgi:hypothetical protein